jgi:2-oxoisovalerate dehydrogenase E1 component
VAFFGDGASNNGAFHEGLNMAAIWDLPALFICENNMYATEVPFAYASRNTEVAQRAAGYGIPGVTVDGNDVLAVYAAAGEALRRARSGGGPTLIECKTYRTRPHAEGMRDGSYRTVEEVEFWKARDPIQQLQATLLADRLASADELARINTEIQALIEVAYEFAKNSPYPDGATASDHVYSAS